MLGFPKGVQKRVIFKWIIEYVVVAMLQQTTYEHKNTIFKGQLGVPLTVYPWYL